MAAKTDDFDQEVSQNESDESELTASAMSDENLQATDTEDGELNCYLSFKSIQCDPLITG